MTDEEEVSETTGYVLVTPTMRVPMEEMPLSPKGVAKKALALGWEVSTWLTTTYYPPTLYVTTKGENVAGTVKFPGYVGVQWMVEARDPGTRAIGFQAQFLGRQYADGRKSDLGKFMWARVADPVGIPRELYYEYGMITQSRDKFETEKSFMTRYNAEKSRVDAMNTSLNDQSYHWPTVHLFQVAGDFTNWLAEWQSYAPRKAAK